MSRLGPCLLAAGLWLPAPLLAQGYGQNHVVLKDFDWHVRSTEHFDIHYYDGSAALVPQAAEILERAYRRIAAGLDTGFVQRRPFFLYADVNDFQQSNIVAVGDGTGGVTEAFKDRFMVFNDGTSQWLEAVVTHELVHIFQFHVLVSGFWKSARILKSFVYPLWMMEGMAEHFTEGYDDSTEEAYVRDAATSGGLLPLWKLEHFSHLKPHQVTLAYKSGSSVMEFIASQYGRDKVGRMLRLFETHFESNSVLQDLLGLDIFAFDRKWREYLEEKYGRQVRKERLQEPSAYGVALTTSSAAIPEFNTSPVFTPDGRSMAYMSTREGYPPVLMLRDLPTGRTRRLVGEAYTRIENIPLGNFTNVSRVLSVSRDGSFLAFAAQKNHAEYIYLYNLARRKLRRIPLPGLMTAAQPAFSPDGSRIAFSGMKGGFTDLYLLDLKTERIAQLTSDPQDDQSPSFTPDGEALVYSSELRVPGSEMPYQRRLYRLELGSLRATRLEELPGAARDPFQSADGGRLLFTLEGGGLSDVYELDVRSGRVLRLTRCVGACYTPAYTPSGDVAFSSFRRGSVHIYRGRRGGFPAESVGPGEVPVRPVPAGASIASLSLPGMEPAVSTGAWAYSSSTSSFLGPERPYRFTASTDLFLPAFFYSSQGGLFWTSFWQGSDLLGNHQALGFLAYNSGQGFLNYQAQYNYSRWRPQLTAGFSGLVRNDAVDQSNGLTADESAHTQFIGARYPLDRFHRLEALAGAASDEISYTGSGARTLGDARFVGGAFVRDTVGGRYLVATRGSRLRLDYARAAEVLGGNKAYYSLGAEAHQYVPTGGLSALVLRGFAGGSWGPDSQQLVLGGLGGVRGYGRSTVENVGNRMALATAEWRFPLLSNLDYYMWYIFPDFYFKAITGAVFSDAGYAWSNRAELSEARWSSLRRSVGVGLRIHTFILQLFPFVIHLDYARRATSNGGVFYVYLGPLF